MNRPPMHFRVEVRNAEVALRIEDLRTGRGVEVQVDFPSAFSLAVALAKAATCARTNLELGAKLVREALASESP